MSAEKRQYVAGYELRTKTKSQDEKEASENWSNGVVKYWSCGFWIPGILDFGLRIAD
jgi:hypothetical protein